MGLVAAETKTIRVPSGMNAEWNAVPLVGTPPADVDPGLVEPSTRLVTAAPSQPDPLRPLAAYIATAGSPVLSPTSDQAQPQRQSELAVRVPPR